MRNVGESAVGCRGAGRPSSGGRPIAGFRRGSRPGRTARRPKLGDQLSSAARPQNDTAAVGRVRGRDAAAAAVVTVRPLMRRGWPGFHVYPVQILRPSSTRQHAVKYAGQHNNCGQSQYGAGAGGLGARKRSASVPVPANDCGIVVFYRCTFFLRRRIVFGFFFLRNESRFPLTYYAILITHMCIWACV